MRHWLDDERYHSGECERNNERNYERRGKGLKERLHVDLQWS